MSSALCTKKNGSALVLEVIYLIFNEGYAATFITAPFGSSPGRPLTQVRRSKNFSGGGNRGGHCHRF
jgi:hypothetical protein